MVDKLYAETLRHLKGYAERNTTCLEFIDDVGHGGCSLEGGWADWNRGKVEIKDKEFKVLLKLNLKQIWQELQQEKLQLTLF